MKRSAVSLLVICCLAAIGPSTLADPGMPTPVQTRLKRVALFKNGFGFFVREGTLPEATVVALLGPFAVPSHGTCWIAAPSSAGLSQVVIRQTTVPEEFEARTIPELLEANVGKEVMLGSPWDSMSLTGTIRSFAPDLPPPSPLDRRYSIGPAPSHNSPDGHGSYMLLETPYGLVAFNYRQYGRLTFISEDFNTTLVRQVPKIEMLARLANPKQGDWLSASYLAQGITWAPSYLIDISDAKKAQLSAKALVINEAEDLEKTHVDLITGFPNLQFADISSPVSRKQSLADFLNALARGPGRAEASVLTQNVASFYGDSRRGGGMGGGGSPGPLGPGYGSAAAGQAAEDLFLYPLEDIALAKGETGYYPLFTETVPYTEIYEWTIPDYINPEGYYRPQQGDQPKPPEIVWHSLRLDNAMSLPWTTAPAQIMKDGQIIGQDTLNYTAPKAEATVKITRAVSVKAEQKELETSRERDALTLYGHHFDRVTIEGTLEVRNYKDKSVSLEVTKTLSGEVSSTSPAAEDAVLARGIKAMNPTHDLTWKLDVEPGETKQITYTYAALIRR
jgi:hypothetical protein